MTLEIKKGTNISHWLSQSKERGEIRKARFQKEDAERIAQWGMDHIRIPVDEEQMWTPGGQRDQEAFDLLQEALGWCQDAGLKAIVDLHIIGSHYFNDSDEPKLFSDPKAQEQFGALWDDLSDFLKDYPTDFLAYELLNEPVARDSSRWNRTYPIPYNIIRAKEKNRTILLGSNFFNQWQTFPELEIPEDENIILTFHYYNPMFITHWKAPWWRQGAHYQGPIQYPGQPVDPGDRSNLDLLVEHGLLRENRYVDGSVMKSDISIPYQVARHKGMKLHCGEFGCMLSIPEEIQKNWFRDLINIFEEWDISWSSWDYKGGFGMVTRDGEESTALKSLMKR